MLCYFKFKTYSFLTVLVFMSVLSAGSLQNTDLTTIKTGLHFGETLTKAISYSPKAFVKFLGSTGLKVVPFISAAVSFVEFILSFLGNNESQELLAVKRLYNEMDRRFDAVELQLEDLKKLINWSQVKIQYSSIEQNILTETELFRRIYTGPLAIKNSGKDYFLHAFENNCLTCAANLYHGLLGKGLTLSSDIFDAAVVSFSYDRPKTQIFMIGMLKLLIQGITNELAYRKMKYGDADYMYHKDLWKSRLQNITAKMISIDEQIRTHYSEQVEKDVTMLSVNNPTSLLSHQNMAAKVYKFLVKKYDWRDWLVVVYNPISTVHHHINNVCDGLRRYGMYGRDILIDSVDQSKPSINLQTANDIISHITTFTSITHSNYNSYLQYYYETVSHEYYNPEGVYNRLPLVVRNCTVYGSVGVIEASANMWYEALPQRLIHSIVDGRFSVHLFG